LYFPFTRLGSSMRRFAVREKLFNCDGRRHRRHHVRFAVPLCVSGAPEWPRPGARASRQLEGDTKPQRFHWEHAFLHAVGFLRDPCDR